MTVCCSGIFLSSLTTKLEKLQCDALCAGALKFWRERSHVDSRAAKEATWGDEAVVESLKSANFWTQGLPYVKSLAGHWKFHLASKPEEVPHSFFDPGFDDTTWGYLPGKIFFCTQILILCVQNDMTYLLQYLIKAVPDPGFMTAYIHRQLWKCGGITTNLMVVVGVVFFFVHNGSAIKLADAWL
jgi:hypothetical protein